MYLSLEIPLLVSVTFHYFNRICHASNDIIPNSDFVITRHLVFGYKLRTFVSYYDSATKINIVIREQETHI